MYQNDLFGVRAQTTGFRITWDTSVARSGEAGSLLVYPTWSKDPSHDRGYWRQDIGQDEQAIVPVLLGEVFSAWDTTRPERTVPRTLTQILSFERRCQDMDVQLRA